MSTFFLTVPGEKPLNMRIQAARPFVIGRGDECDFVVDDSRVSRRHCELTIRASALFAKDLGSRNGVYVNGIKAEGDVRVRPGDQLLVGTLAMTIEGTESSAPRKRQMTEDTLGVPSLEEQKTPETAPASPPAPPRLAAPVSGATTAARPASDLLDKPLETMPLGARGGPPKALFSAQPPPSAPAPRGFSSEKPQIPGYDVHEALGDRPTASVYRATALDDKREVEVTVLEKSRARDDVEVKGFLREARALQKLDHPYIVRIRATGSVAGWNFYVTERLIGDTLDARLKAGPLGIRKALAMATQVAEAISSAHKENIIHRGISPSSIVLHPSGLAKLVNFTFAKSIGPSGGFKVTRIGDAIGDHNYASPELLRDPSDVDPRADLYSLGATLFHAIAGAPPHAGMTRIEVFQEIMNKPAPNLRDRAKDCPSKVNAIVTKLLARDAKDRYQSGDDVVRALEEALLDIASPKAASGAGATSMLSGDFSGTEFVDVVQFLEFNRRDGILTIVAPPLEGEIRMVGGDIVAARATRNDEAPIEGELAAIEILASPDGQFRFRAMTPEAVGAGTGARLKGSALAMEAMRRRDEMSLDALTTPDAKK